jgi:hypothetical protein
MGALSVMSKDKPFSDPKPFCGPMTTQPLENGETISTQTQPMMPAVGRPRTAVKKPSIKTQPLAAEIAQKSRRNSLRKQREAQKAKPLLK